MSSKDGCRLIILEDQEKIVVGNPFLIVGNEEVFKGGEGCLRDRLPFSFLKLGEKRGKREKCPQLKRFG